MKRGKPSTHIVEEIAPGVHKYSNGTTYKLADPPTVTHTGHKLNVREAKFLASYLAGNTIRQAEEEAGYKPGGGRPVLSRDYIMEEVRYRLDAMKSERIADASEILEYLSSVMRGEISDQFGLEAPLSERTKAAMELAKRQIDMPQKLAAAESQPEIKVTLNWSRDNADSQSE